MALKINTTFDAESAKNLLLMMACIAEKPIVEFTNEEQLKSHPAGSYWGYKTEQETTNIYIAVVEKPWLSSARVKTELMFQITHKPAEETYKPSDEAMAHTNAAIELLHRKLAAFRNAHHGDTEYITPTELKKL